MGRHRGQRRDRDRRQPYLQLARHVHRRPRGDEPGRTSYRVPDRDRAGRGPDPDDRRRRRQAGHADARPDGLADPDAGAVRGPDRELHVDDDGQRLQHDLHVPRRVDRRRPGQLSDHRLALDVHEQRDPVQCPEPGAIPVRQQQQSPGHAPGHERGAAPRPSPRTHDGAPFARDRDQRSDTCRVRPRLPDLHPPAVRGHRRRTLRLRQQRRLERGARGRAPRVRRGLVARQHRSRAAGPPVGRSVPANDAPAPGPHHDRGESPDGAVRLRLERLPGVRGATARRRRPARGPATPAHRPQPVACCPSGSPTPGRRSRRSSATSWEPSRRRVLRPS